MTDSIYTEGWLIRSRDRGMHFPPFKSKWVRRYFVLRVLDRTLGTYVLDEFRKEDKRRLRKSLDLTRCVQVFYNYKALFCNACKKWRFRIDSHLQLADSSCSTTSRFGGFQWIFSLYFTKGTSSNKKTPVYFVSESEEKMKDWVYNLCRACRLEKETDDDNNSYLQQQPPEMEAPSHRSTLPSSLAGLSIYSDRSSESMLDTPRSEVSRDFEVAAPRTQRGDDELHDFEFVQNPKRVSRFNSRLCTASFPPGYATGSISNPVTPSDANVTISAPKVPTSSKSNLFLREYSSRDIHHHKCTLMRHSFSQNFSDIIGMTPFKLHLKREMNALTSRATAHDQEELQANRSKRPNFHSRNLRNHHNTSRHPSMTTRKSSLQRRHRRTDSAEVPRASSSASACSSITSDRRSEDGDDDSTSCISQISNLSCGPPIPPRAVNSFRTRLAPQYSSASSSTGTPVKKFDLSQTLPPSAHSVIDETIDNDSSGETIKMHGIVTYANSQCSSDAGFRALSAYEPPAVDRSNKPAKLRLYDYDEDKVPEEMTIHGYNKSGTNFTRVQRTPVVKNSSRYRDIRDPPRSAGPHGRSRELDYFNPVPLERARLIRSPVPADIEYIKIDAEKTQAVKHSIAQRGTVD